MKKSVKLFGVVAVSLFLFSCSTDELDADFKEPFQYLKTSIIEPEPKNQVMTTTQKQLHNKKEHLILLLKEINPFQIPSTL